MNNTKRINAEQRERLLDLVEQNRSLLFVSKSQGNVLKNQAWRDIAGVLNKLGSEKTVDQWRKTWTDIKSGVKKKAAELKAFKTTFGTEYPSEMQLSEEDYQVLRMCNINIMDGIAESPALSNLQRMNFAQRQTMIHQIEDNLAILCDPNTDKRLEKWSAISDILNTIGPRKSTENWRKAWIDMKKAAKRKMACAKTASGSVLSNDVELTEEDLRVMRIYEAESSEQSQETDEVASDEPPAQGNDFRTDYGMIDPTLSLPEGTQLNVEMENLRWMNHTDTIMNFQKSLKDNLETCDITLAFKDKSVKAHRCVLSACSTLLREVLRDVPSGQDATIIVPDSEGSLLDSIMNFIYMGETNISSTRLEKFLEIIGSLGIKSPISFDCTGVTATNKEQLEAVEIESIASGVTATNKEQLEAFEIESIASIELDSDLKEEVIDIDDEEDFAFVDHTTTSQLDLIEDSNDEANSTSNQSETFLSYRSGASTPSAIVETTCSKNGGVLVEQLDMDSPMTEDSANDPIGDGKPNAKRSRNRSESSDVDVGENDKITEPQTFRDRVNRLRAQQKKSLQSAFFAHTEEGMSLRKAAITYNISRTALLREVGKQASTVIFDSSDEEEETHKSDLIRLRKHIRVKSNPLDIADEKFIKLFGMSKEAFSYVLKQVKDKLPEAKRSSSVPAVLKLAATLRFLTEGSYQKGMGNDFALGLAQPTLSKVLKDMLIAIETHLCPQWIKPEYTEEEKMQAKLYFYKQAGIPGVIGCVTGTHVKILAPNQLEQGLYHNEKGFHSLNVMIVCDHRMFIRYVDANQPGANNDASVWNTSEFRGNLRENYQKGEKNTWLLGHGGYPLEPFLITPYRRPVDGSNESSFNKRHDKTRCIIDKTIAILKSRFQCLLGERQLHYTPQKSAQIVNVCVALHNICLHYKSHLEVEVNLENEFYSKIYAKHFHVVDQVAVDIRDQLLDAIQRIQ